MLTMSIGLLIEINFSAARHAVVPFFGFSTPLPGMGQCGPAAGRRNIPAEGAGGPQTPRHRRDPAARSAHGQQHASFILPLLYACYLLSRPLMSEYFSSACAFARIPARNAMASVHWSQSARLTHTPRIPRRTVAPWATVPAAVPNTMHLPSMAPLATLGS